MKIKLKLFYILLTFFMMTSVSFACVNDQINPNGSIKNIAGIFNKEKNCFRYDASS